MRISWLGIVLFALGIVAAPMQSTAQNYSGMTLARYERLTSSEASAREKEVVDVYFEGVVTAVVFLDIWPSSGSARRFFCKPEHVEFDRDKLRALVATELALNGETWRRTPNAPIEQVAVRALGRRYPCR